MKKVLALVLAVMMLATVALAADLVPGKKIKLERAADSGIIGAADAASAVCEFEYGDNTWLAKSLNSDNYSITSIKYNEGKSLIDSIKIDDDEEQVVVALKQDYENTKNKEFDIEFTIKGKGKYKDDNDKNVSVPDVDVRIKGTVGYTLQEVALDDEDINVDGYDLANDLIKFKKGEYSYATLYQDYEGSEVSLEVRVYDGNKLFLNCDTDPVTSVLKANADSDADMYFYNFEGEPTFDATAKLYFNDADEDMYVYQLKDGKLVKAGSYSEDDGCWVVKARTLGQYVVSTEKLSNASGEDTTEEVDNPDTGANDVVGIAAALGAVALVSAAAVSLKK